MNRILTFVCLLAATGCGGNGGEVVRADAFKALAEAESAFGAKDYAKAADAYTRAIEAGGLGGEVLADAHLHRGMARLETGSTDGGAADLDMAEQGSALGPDYLAARGLLALKHGDRTKAREFYLEARRSDPRIAIPKELN